MSYKISPSILLRTRVQSHLLITNRFTYTSLRNAPGRVCTACLGTQIQNRANHHDAGHELKNGGKEMKDKAGENAKQVYNSVKEYLEEIKPAIGDKVEGVKEKSTDNNAVNNPFASPDLEKPPQHKGSRVDAAAATPADVRLSDDIEAKAKKVYDNAKDKMDDMKAAIGDKGEGTKEDSIDNNAVSNPFPSPDLEMTPNTKHTGNNVDAATAAPADYRQSGDNTDSKFTQDGKSK
ncbi:hypothetical protein SARC_06097 [Sphaeroforma arctica JP610]|uniref:Uncharacterized protein n=1 Tax=Sphaeroforma arctica JP610 TaxID=667725 RepID=A0A0L0FYH5_9EUKA|nr:hypothetical protein SARC_06097 [Sphaeroforma arctica JP610]KNC81596.1 hypothetical protein SARC_06097 [Sphaeroforma arctica JP610]|eukprot:XP_014155498.1 hypothetical protein SARC_06097 [Sphaeroforma arctica JP610]